VREGRSSSFLPLPVPLAAAAEGEQQQQQQEVLAPCPALADLPVDRWLVKSPELMDDDNQEGMAITQVGRSKLQWRWCDCGAFLPRWVLDRLGRELTAE
jgi:hypothetical protein